MSGNEAHAFQPQTARTPAGLPGGWAALLIAMISALVAGMAARPKVEGPGSVGPSDVSRLSEVAPDEIGAALQTLDASPEQIAQFLARQPCRRKLAWVVLGHLPNRPAGRIRLQSGKYISPAFDLSDGPVRVALPYPAPYPAGQGTIAVVGASSDVSVALTPPWQVAGQQGLQSREVTWTPAGGCPAANRPAG